MSKPPLTSSATAAATVATPSPKPLRTSILTRKLDLLYLIFFLIHIPLMIRSPPFPLSPPLSTTPQLIPHIVIDLPPLYTPYLPALLPASISTPLIDFLAGVRRNYVERYRDRFFMRPPAWFRGFLWLEAGVHGGVGGWCLVGGGGRGALVGGEFFFLLGLGLWGGLKEISRGDC